ncbi:tight adherence protein B [Nocardioides scoriae]|uniref:Tight adherence protein B n=1 Tax=Nocardioides scoriae TaxID=642780 RepID=A0A1H1UD20_9ACTN|nr:type II secretion system F family protein [Nocardioides scoriae]SDS70384.1 tight adherence protein B [Nocardioides scoriae]
MTGAPVALLVALAVALLLRPARPLPVPTGGAGGVPRPLQAVAVALAVPLAWAWLEPRHLVLALMATAVTLGVVRGARRRRRARAADLRRDRVLEACESMAADLTAGQPPVRALRAAVEEWSELAPVLTAGLMDADVPQALRRVGGLPGAADLRTLAAAWQVAHETGAPLAPSVSRAADAARARRRTSRLVASELAAAHATARTLAVLPGLVMLMAVGIGADPIGFLTGTTGGLVCLGLGLTLSWLGLWWLERIADGVLR